MFDAIKAVLWSFFGIRSSKGYERDRAKLKLWQIVAAGFFCVLVFVSGLFFLVKFLTSK
jgi:hypothetical protein